MPLYDIVHKNLHEKTLSLRLFNKPNYFNNAILRRDIILDFNIDIIMLPLRLINYFDILQHTDFVS
jgi:hypothetical protein